MDRNIELPPAAMVELVRKKLVEQKGNFREIEEKSGLSYSYLHEFAKGQNLANPSFERLACLARWLGLRTVFVPGPDYATGGVDRRLARLRK